MRLDSISVMPFKSCKRLQAAYLFQEAVTLPAAPAAAEKADQDDDDDDEANTKGTENDIDTGFVDVCPEAVATQRTRRKSPCPRWLEPCFDTR